MVSIDYENREFDNDLYRYIMDHWGNDTISGEIIKHNHINILENDIQCSLSTIIEFRIPENVIQELNNYKDELGHSLDEKRYNIF